MGDSNAVTAALRTIFSDASCRGWLHAVALGISREVSLDPHTRVTPASVIKVLVAVEADNQMADGRLHPADQVKVTADLRTPGPVGLSLFSDDATLSL